MVEPIQRPAHRLPIGHQQDRKSTRLNSSHVAISYAVFCLKKKTDGGARSVFIHEIGDDEDCAVLMGGSMSWPRRSSPDLLGQSCEIGRVIGLVFFFNDTATTEIYTLSLHDALPICGGLHIGLGLAHVLDLHALREPA